jgi:hypothetical protein
MSTFFSSDRYLKFKELMTISIADCHNFLDHMQSIIRCDNPDPPVDYSINEATEQTLLINIHRLLDPDENDFDDIDHVIRSALRGSGIFKSSHAISPFFSNYRYQEFIHFLRLADLDLTQHFLDLIKDAICVIDPDPSPNYYFNEIIEAQFLMNVRELLIPDPDLDLDEICLCVQKALRASDLFKSQAYHSPFFSDPRCAEFIIMMTEIFNHEIDEDAGDRVFIRRLKNVFCTGRQSVPRDFCIATEALETEFLKNFWCTFFEFDPNDRLSVEISIALSEARIATYAQIFDSGESDSELDRDELRRPCDCICDCGCLMTPNTKRSPPPKPPAPELTSSDFIYLDSKDKLDRFLCPICLQPALDPIITTCCGEIQCRSCFMQTVEAMGFIRPTCSGCKKMMCCSKCKTMINSNSILRIPGGFQDFFDELKVQCVKCDHICQRNQFPSHWQSQCQHEIKSN